MMVKKGFASAVGAARKLAAGAAVLALSAGMASAVTVTVIAASGDGSTLAANNAHIFAADFGTDTRGGIWSPSDANVITPPPGSEDSVFRSPWDNTILSDTNSYFAVGPSPNDPNPVTLTYGGSGLSVFELLWGSVDTYNVLTFGTVGGASHVFNGTTIAGLINDAFAGTCRDSGSNRACTARLRFSFGDDAMTTAMFLSDGAQAFEFALAPIPLPAPALLLLTGLGTLGGVAAIRRRREKAA